MRSGLVAAHQGGAGHSGRVSAKNSEKTFNATRNSEWDCSESTAHLQAAPWRVVLGGNLEPETVIRVPPPCGNVDGETEVRVGSRKYWKSASPEKNACAFKLTWSRTVPALLAGAEHRMLVSLRTVPITSALSKRQTGELGTASLPTENPWPMTVMRKPPAVVERATVTLEMVGSVREMFASSDCGSAASCGLTETNKFPIK